MPKPLVSGLGVVETRGGLARLAGKQQAHYQRRAGFSTISSPISASDGCGESVLDWTNGHDCTSRWIQEVRSSLPAPQCINLR